MKEPQQRIVLFPIPMGELENIIKACIKAEFQKAIPPPIEEDALITRQEAAKLLHVSLGTLNKFCKRGTVVSYRLGSVVRLKKNEVLGCLREVKSLKHSRNQI